jgi:antitoxin YefM
MDSVLETEANQNLNQLVNQVAVNHVPILIKGEQHDAVLVAKEDWEAIQETIYLTSIPGMRESILEGGNTSLEECVPLTEIEW